MKFISKGEWFDKGTEAELLVDFGPGWEPPCGLFSGIKDGHEDEETCTFDEFEIIE